MYGLVMLFAMILHLVFGIKGLKKLIIERASLKSFLTQIFFCLLLTFAAKVLFYSLYSGEEVYSLTFGLFIIYSSLFIFMVPAFIFYSININISRMLFSCLLISMLYFFMIDEHLMDYFSITYHY